MTIAIREVRGEDTPQLGRIAYEAFAAIANAHNFPPDFPNAEIATTVIGMMAGAPGVYGVVAEDAGQMIGSNFIHEYNAVSGIGPITVDPRAQNRGVGAALMKAVLDRAAAQQRLAVRLVQAGYHTRSLSLYARLGFEVRDHLSCFQGNPLRETVAGLDVRPATEADIFACNRLCRSVHGVDRAGDVAHAIGRGSARVVERRGRITGYTSGIAFFGHAVGETTDDVKALIAAAESFGGPGFLVPSRNGELMRWCLSKGLRVTQPMTLMTVGLYSEPAGAWLPSVMY
ncbi:MAG TPA: GNAT family N-acetyltransferase [Rhizomicrobium sp.]|nr:GNAT family N-acetyltransferase [Rhizomicrobium sp.]